MSRVCVFCWAVLLSVLLVRDVRVVAVSQRPLQVFLLAGQSNMVGMASIDHLTKLVHQSNDNQYRRQLWDESANDFLIRSDVIMKYGENTGNLTVGQGFASHNHFGPELGFGWVLGDSQASGNNNSTEPIVLIKSAYGGRTLAVDFRPPLSGEGNFSDVKPVHYGWEYRQMIADFLEALDTLSDYVPQYNKKVGYELKGFVWFQGWNDMLDWRFVNEYGFNLANFIRDIRHDLDAPGLPVIVGELGMHGLNPTGRGADRVMHMRAFERGVTLLNEFRNNTLFVRTAPYVVLNATSSYGGGYHYFGRADTYFHIGQAFGKGMLKFWKE